ncbi:HPr-rel-A system PqqD family peptide chaperone [Rhodoferax ferrireducens]|uniref:HPr-rel-A system PqqD family peptide chaperone n=1 Tax=Rhodoferax ferrireducens TaxID=192843 RepID=UPI000E0CCD29|nr:HPr-rel-A system PqqD family peptide chaperone [Rhodoferax ferrireducens]
MVWHLNALASLHWRCWNDEWAVFDVGSGQTHQMDTLTAVTLMMVEATSLSLSELVSWVAEEMLIPCDQELSHALSGILERLAAAGLIESASQ